MSFLFRPEALIHQNEHRLGKAFLKIPRSYSVFLWFLLATTLLFILLLVLGDYTRKETVSGTLVSSSGVVHVYAPRSGKVSALSITDGAKVSSGKNLLTLQEVTHFMNGGSLNQQQKSLLNLQLLALSKQIKNETLLSEEVQLRQQASIKERKSSLWQLGNHLKLGQALTQLKQKQYQQAISLTEQGHLTKSAQDDSYQQLLQQQQNQESIKQNLMAQQRELKQIEHDLLKQPLLLKKTLSQLEKQQAELNNRLALLNAQNAEQLQASIDGHITNLQVHDGEQVTQGQLLMTLLPINTQLEAELYLPSRAAGFISAEQQVRLRYSAFPYQRYGVFNGKVIEVGKVVLTPTELKGSLPLAEAVYRVIVQIEKQSILAFGTNNRLQPGMQLEADIVLDTMTLLDWVLMPIYAIKGRL